MENFWCCFIVNSVFYLQYVSASLCRLLFDLYCWTLNSCSLIWLRIKNVLLYWALRTQCIRGGKIRLRCSQYKTYDNETALYVFCGVGSTRNY